ncbi:glycosyltransferase family 39 protein [Actinomadura viridis]|uniref:glycosyltransferase family 39 protein n=1 Tax=Actinomadura viridis TaxID=58110 RepID=UPI00367F9D46
MGLCRPAAFRQYDGGKISCRPGGDPETHTDAGALTDTSTIVSSRTRGSGRENARPWPRRTVVIVPSAVTFAVAVWGIRGPSLWRDEAATLSAVRRTPGELWSMLQNIDAVHGLYYFLLWPFVRWFGDSEIVVRLPSAAAMAVAAFGVTVLGGRLLSHRVGMLAGLVFAVTPTVSRYGQEARSTAFVVALATFATLLLVLAVERGTARWYAAYALLLASTIAAGLMSVLLIPAHLVYILLSAGPGGNRKARVRAWASSAAIALVAASPFAVLAWRQRSAVQWIQETDTDQVFGVVSTLFGGGYVFVLLPLAAIGAMGALGGRRFAHAKTKTKMEAEAEASPEASPGASPGVSPAGARVRTFRFLLAWMLLPGALLLLVSLAQPMFLFRYLACSFPAVALVSGAVLADMGNKTRIAVVAVAAILFVPAHQVVRTPDAHGGDDIRALSDFVGGHKRPDDAVVFLPAFWRHVTAAYPEGFSGLRDIAQEATPRTAATLTGSEVDVPEFNRRLETVRRVWIVEPGEPDLTGVRTDPLWAAKNAITGSPGFAGSLTRKSGGYRVRLYTRSR